jgi:EpsI family protein
MKPSAPSKKHIIVLILLATGLGLSYGLPKTRYTSPDVISGMQIPVSFRGWRSQDISDQLKLTDDRYNFISRSFGRVYGDEFGDSLLFLILDAGNFHNPKVCFSSSGFTYKDLPDTPFTIKGRTFNAPTIFFQKGTESVVLIYWLSINKKIVNWNTQKILQLWYSLLNKQKVGLMVRIEVPSTLENAERSVKLAQDFLAEASANLPEDQLDYLFGK